MRPPYTGPGSLLPEEVNALAQHVIAEIVRFDPRLAVELDEWFEWSVGTQLGKHYQLKVASREEVPSQPPNKGRAAPAASAVIHHDLIITTAASEAALCTAFAAAIEAMWKGDSTKARAIVAKPGETHLLITCSSADPRDKPFTFTFLLHGAFTEVLARLPAPEPLAAK